MKVNLVLSGLLASLAVAGPLDAQEGKWSETRFERVYLRNGNFIDGHLLQESSTFVLLDIPGGQMKIRTDSIDSDARGRLRIELIKMRSYEETPKLLRAEARKPAAPAVSEPVAAPPTPSEVRSEVISLTGSIQEQLKQAEALLKAGPPERQKSALEALMKLGAEGAPLVASLIADFDDSVVPSASLALQSMREPYVLPAIRPLLRSERVMLREAGAAVLGALGNLREDAADLRSLLDDSETRVRGAAISALQRLGDFESFDRIADLVNDSNVDLRSRAMSAVVEFAQKGGLNKKLADLLSRNLERAAGQARIDLTAEAARLSLPELGPVLSRLATDSDAMVRSHAILGLSKLNAQEYSGLVLDQLATERDYWPRVQLANAAQAMKLAKAIDPLIQWLGDEDANIRAAAYRALQGITGMNLGTKLEDWQEWRAKTNQK
jgi:HEAT repeat protein